MKTPKKEAVKAPTIGDRLLTLREAAEVLRLNPRTVRVYVQRGEIEGRLIGGRWRFRRPARSRGFLTCSPHLKKQRTRACAIFCELGRSKET